MATAVHKVSLQHSAPVAGAALHPRHQLPSRVYLGSRSALSQPWWRQLALALPQGASASVAPKRPIGGRGIVALASEGEAAEPSTAVEDAPATEEAAAATEEAASAAEEEAPAEPKAPVMTVKQIMNILNAQQAKKLKAERGLPELWPGDVVAMKVEVPENKRRVSLVRGIVIGRSNAGINSTFRIRRIMAGVGVEMVFPLYSPNIKEIKVVGKRRARRAKLYYLRDKIARLSTVN